MGVYEVSEIMAYRFFDYYGNVEIVCPDCLSDDDILTDDCIMTERDFDEEKLYFCDRSGELISG